MANTSNLAPQLNTLLQLRSKLQAQTGAELRFDAATRGAYASEASNYRQPPLGIVIPKTIADLVEAVRLCGELSVPIVPRGAGTSMCGQSVNAAVCIDHSKYLNAVEGIDPGQRTAIVQPGVICDQLKQAAAVHGLTFGPDPATHSRCTLGGMIGNNSCGAHSVMAGKTVENIERLEVVTTTGERFWVGATDQDEYEQHLAAGGERAQIVRGLKALVDRHENAIRSGYPKLKRRVSGYNLDQLLPENGFNIARALVGSEGTCVTVTRAETRLVTHPRERVLVVLGFETIFDAADCVPDLLPLGPIAMEGLDDGIIHGLRDLGLRLDDIAELPAGNAWLMIEFGAQQRPDAVASAERAVAVAERLGSKPSYRLVDDARLMHRLWSIRETGASATSLSNVPGEPDPVVGWEDAAVEPARLGAYLREFSALVARYGYRTNLYGHFGDGCIHSRITFDLQSKQGVQHWRAFLEEAARLVVAHGGSLSGEHGDGQAKGEFLPLMYSPELMQAFREFKAIWDPKGLMNPGKLIDAMSADMHLRRGPEYRQVEVETAFAFGEGTTTGFARETERCIGMGKCRSLEGGTMCPSFKATREELYSTRGRARLFFEMLRGDVVTGGWQDEAIKDSLDLCLACKGCKSDCPTHVDIPKYRSEFLSRYHQKHRRKPMDAMIGRIGQWLPLAAPLARPVNAMMRQPVLRQLAKTMGLAPSVKFPKLALKSFRSDATANRLSDVWPEAFGAKDVVLWVDTFNNGFTPAVLEAAVRVIERAGWTPRLTRRHVCCGRPLYDVGLLEKARENLLEILNVLELAIETGVPVLVLEPSCLSVFRDELPSLLPEDRRALLLSKLVITTAEFAKSAGLALPAGDAVHVHPHCHQRACGGTQAESQLGARVLDTGCCGMAGAFGYHTKTAEVARKVGELELLPKLQSVKPEDVLVSDGFSCRCQISHLGGRQAKHLVEVLAEPGVNAKNNN
ncbi:FAD-binding and (Fe-S)-binding domain-containing protein [Ralstonia flaminis]|jgi:FAD/FMN-containing dehydrogenase/Fe-S oxidoreductase|nr:FAD-binding and (Fe-S)-binding domain-containing protein [Ralstonia sp. LMG 18101]